jgi:NADH-quinone oxidoreductase subunit G
VGTVTITVDGREVLAHPGEMVIAAAERAGVYIPRFCYHPRMRPVGMCRMCLVDIKGPRGFALQPACFLPVAGGQEVCTTSPRVKKAQDGVLEFLLVNHPLDCPVCDKGGECPLQDQTLTYGPGESRFIEEKRHWEKPISLSSLVYLDRERCIQCDRCTRFADEVAGDPLIDFVGRGDRIEVNTFPDSPFASYFSGNTVQICPVGALTATPYRFRARPWDLEQVESTCTTCAVGCRMAVQSSSNSLTRYLGIDSDPVNHGWLCDKGRFAFEAVNGEERLSRPLVRVGEDLVPTSWGEALEAAAKALREVRALHGPASIAVLGGARLANEDAYAWAKLAKSVIGTDSVDAQMDDGLPAEAVLGLPRATIDQACSAAAVVLLGPDLKEELPVLYLRLRAAVVDGGARLVELVPASGGMTRYATASLAYRPGEVAQLARALVAPGDPTDGVAGVSAAEVAGARRVLAEAAGHVVVVLGRPSMAESGEAVAEAAGVLADGLPDVRFLPALRRGNVHGALDMGLAPGVLPGRVGLDEGRDWWSQAWGVIPEQRGLDGRAILTAAAEGRVQALILVGADPVSDFPDAELARRGVAGAGFVLAVDAHLTESSRQADVVLAAAGYAERPGTTTNLEGRITRLGQKIVPPGVAWPDWMIATELALRAGGNLGFERIEDIWDEIERYAPSHAGITRRLLASPLSRDGVVAPLSEETASRIVPGTGRPGGGPELLELAPDTGGGTQPVPAPIDPMSDPGIDAAETQGVSATEVVPEVTSGVAPDEEEPDAEPARPDPGSLPPPLRYRGSAAPKGTPQLDSYSLRLVSGHTLYDQGVAVQRSPSLSGLAPVPRLRANPYDLDRLGVTTGDHVRVRSRREAIELEVVADPGVPRGSAVVPFNLPAKSAAELVDSTSPVSDVRLETV